MVHRRKASAVKTKNALRRAVAKANREAYEKRLYQNGFDAGVKQALQRSAVESKAAVNDANIKLANALSQLVDTVSRTVLTFIGEGGVRFIP